MLVGPRVMGRRRTIAVLVLVTSMTVGCSTRSGDHLPPAEPTVTSYASVASQLADADHAPALVQYSAAIDRLRSRCDPQSILINAGRDARLLGSAGLPGTSRLDVLEELAVATKALDQSCPIASAAYLAEVLHAQPSRTAGGWGGYAGTVQAFGIAHRPFSGRPGTYLPKLPDGDPTYQVFTSGTVTGVFRRFDPPVSQPVALAVVIRDLLPGKLHVVYALHAAQCQQEIYAGPALGRLTGSPDEGAFVELTSGKGVGKTPYDPKRVDRARLTPGSAIGGQPCT